MRVFSRDVFVRRMNELASRRKIFVVTSNYLGPTQCAQTREIEDDRVPAEFFVPNLMRVLGFGDDREELWGDICAASKQLIIRKSLANFRLVYTLVGEIMPANKYRVIREQIF